MQSNLADRLLSAIQEKNAPVCVGLDPLADRLPASLRREFGLPGPSETSGFSTADESVLVEALKSFGRGIIDTVAPIVPAIKINIAFFERLHVSSGHTSRRNLPVTASPPC